MSRILPIVRAARIPALALALSVALGLAGGLAGAEAAALENCLEAEAAHQAGEPGREIALYTRCIDEDRPGDANLAIAHNNRGVARLAVGDATRAIEDYDRALSLDPAYAAAHANRGMAHLAQGAFARALRDYDRAIALDPAYAPAYAYRCWLFGFMGEGAAALADCETSLGLAPDDPGVLDSRAFAHWILEDRQSARRDLDRARRLDPARPAWQRRFVEFEKIYSVGYPTSAAAIRSAGRGETGLEAAAPSAAQ
jgi:tetratricopeptide (TPR) repeat protein